MRVDDVASSIYKALRQGAETCAARVLPECRGKAVQVETRVESALVL